MSNPNRDFCLFANRRPFAAGGRTVARGLALALGLFAPIANALPEDQQQPIRVTADNAVQENNTVTYRGNVVVVQGTIKIAADQVLIYHDKGKLQKAVATGKPVRFQEQPDAKGGLMTGQAGTLIYYNTDQRVELIQDALVDRDQSTLRGQRIEYLMGSKTLRADGAATNSQPGRVEMVLQPNKDEAAKDSQPAEGTQPGSTPAQTPATEATPAPPAPATPQAEPR
jgi:lipopolysaccharide export system protein LptA